MDYDLSRIDYTICGITYPDTLKILPLAGPKLQQKVPTYLNNYGYEYHNYYYLYILNLIFYWLVRSW